MQLHIQKVSLINICGRLKNEKFTYKVQHLYVMKVPDQEYYSYSMVIGRLYNGMVVDTSSDFLLADGKSYPYTHCGNHIMATMCHKKTLDYVNTGFECFDIASTKAHKKNHLATLGGT